MPDPQAGIIPEPSQSSLFLILSVPHPVQDGPAVAKVTSRIPNLTQKVAKLDPRAKLVSVASLGSELWDILFPGKRPRGFRPFKSIQVAGRSAPATGGDLLIHLISRRQDLCFELATRIRKELGGTVDLLDEVHGFRYLDARDLTGFIDGTENPKGKQRAEVALIGQEDADFAGGSFVFTQRYVHDLEKWEMLPVREQEKIIGRRKRDSVELSDRTKPATSHISRTVIEEGDEELEIVRHSFPYGTTSERGLFFIAYTGNLDIPEKMLARMMGTSGDGLHDHLMDFSRAVSGANFFAPSLRVLRALAKS
ncbi:MAG: Dyp-type peroxidase [Myxococcota bacterium]